MANTPNEEYIILPDRYDLSGGIMRLSSYARDMIRWLTATLVAAAITSLMAWLGANATTAGLIFLVLVVWFAAQAGILASAICRADLRAFLRLLFSAAGRHVAGSRAFRHGWP